MVTLGALLMTVPAYLAAHKTGDAAGVLMTGANDHHSLNFSSNPCSQVFKPWGRGGDFILVLLALSVIANNSKCRSSVVYSILTCIVAQSLAHV